MLLFTLFQMSLLSFRFRFLVSRFATPVSKSLTPPSQVHPHPRPVPIPEATPIPGPSPDTGEGGRRKKHSFLVTSPRVGERPGERWHRTSGREVALCGGRSGERCHCVTDQIGRGVPFALSLQIPLNRSL